MSDNHDDNNNGHTTTQAPADTVDAMVEEAQRAIKEEGLRLENLISPRSFIAAERLSAFYAGKARGADPMALGHLAGYVRGYERRESTLPVKPGEKAAAPSVWLRGVFEATVYETGEIKSGSCLILPRVMGEALADALDAGETNALLDVELGVEATGKMIPYTYTIKSFHANRAQAAITAIRMNAQQRRSRALSVNTTFGKQAQLPRPTASPTETPAERAAAEADKLALERETQEQQRLMRQAQDKRRGR
jgi:hypothetical protein